jgi:calcineurin-like phosphoesterase family protein
MDDALIENWNNVVGKKDRVYILGDFAWKEHRKYVNALNGKKILILGTHDKMDKLSLQQFSQVIGSTNQPGILELVLDKQQLVLAHYRLTSWRKSFHSSWHFYGHSHGRMREYPDVLSCDVGVDVWEYAPVHWDILQLKMRARQQAWRNRKNKGNTEWEEYDKYIAPLREANQGFINQYKEDK